MAYTPTKYAVLNPQTRVFLTESPILFKNITRLCVEFPRFLQRFRNLVQIQQSPQKPAPNIFR